MSLSVALWGILALLQVADIGTTYYALERRTGAAEANPVLDWLFKRFGVLPSLLVVKAAMAVALWFIQPPLLAAGVLVAVYAYVVGNNVKIIRRL